MFGFSFFGKHKATQSKFAVYRQRADELTKFTPDYVELQTQNAHNIFIYNEIQIGEPRHDVLKSTHFYRGFAYTSDPTFVLYKKLLGKESFPIALEVHDEHRVGKSSYIGTPHQIAGEIYTCSTKVIADLDKYVLHGVHFQRKKVQVIIPYKTSVDADFESVVVEAWMYVGNPEFWLPQISGAGSDKLFAPLETLLIRDYEQASLNDHYRYKTIKASK